MAIKGPMHWVGGPFAIDSEQGFTRIAVSAAHFFWLLIHFWGWTQGDMCPQISLILLIAEYIFQIYFSNAKKLEKKVNVLTLGVPMGVK